MHFRLDGVVFRMVENETFQPMPAHMHTSPKSPSNDRILDRIIITQTHLFCFDFFFVPRRPCSLSVMGMAG